MARPRLTPEEREARQRDRNRRGFANAKFAQYDPDDGIGYGSARQWRDAAGAAIGGEGFTMQPAQRRRRQLDVDLAEFGLSKLPSSVRDLHLVYRRLVMVKHPNGRGTHQGFLAFQQAYERLREMIEGKK